MNEADEPRMWVKTSPLQKGQPGPRLPGKVCLERWLVWLEQRVRTKS